MIRTQRFFGKCPVADHNSKRANPHARGHNDDDYVTSIQLEDMRDPLTDFEDLFGPSEAKLEQCRRGPEHKCHEQVDHNIAYLHYYDVPEICILHAGGYA